jgi:hypothetical protein
MTEREFLTKVMAMNGVAKDVADYAAEGIAKLDARNDKRKNTPTKTQKDNEDVAQAILAALANGAMVSVDLATATGYSVNKINGVALNLVNEGKLTKTKVKIKGRGDLTSYSLVATVEVNEDEGEEANTDTASTEDTAEN